MGYEDIPRLQTLFENSNKRRNEAALDINQTQIDAASERTQFFEKLAIGSGAAIAAIVSFLGVHASMLQPHWALRCSLLSLGVVMIAALYRNLCYPDYLLTVKRRLWMEAAREQNRCKTNYVIAVPTSINLDDGMPIDKMEWQKNFIGSDARMSSVIDKVVTNEGNLLAKVDYAERVCLGALCVAMITLVWLALRSF